jgi:hypothetical protein
MSAASELKTQQTAEEKQIRDMLSLYKPDITFEDLCFEAGFDYDKSLASDNISKAFISALVEQTAFFRKRIREKISELGDAERQQIALKAEILESEQALEHLMARIAQVRQLQ